MKTQIQVFILKTWNIRAAANWALVKFAFPLPFYFFIFRLKPILDSTFLQNWIELVTVHTVLLSSFIPVP